MMEQTSLGVAVSVPDPRVLTALTEAVRKLGHDVNNAMVSSVSLCELEGLDDPAAAPALERIGAELGRPRSLFDHALRTLPSRSTCRLQNLEDWRIRVAAEADAAQCMLRLPTDLTGPAGLSELDWVQCLDNIVSNALESIAMGRRVGHDPAGGAVHVSRIGTAAGGELVVTDDGPGCCDLAAAAAGRLRRSGGGHLGQGLGVVALHLTAVGGGVWLAQGPQAGLRVTLRWSDGTLG